MEGRRRIYSQNILNFKKSTFVEKVLRGSQEGSSPWAAAGRGCCWGCWVWTADALLRDLVQRVPVTSSGGCKSGTTPVKSGELRTAQTKEPGAFGVVTAKPGCASSESPGLGFCADEEDHPPGRYRCRV